MLEPLVGQFRCQITMWMAPGTEPMQSVGTSTHRWILGGRFVEQIYNGTFMGQPFEGQGMTGYDKVRDAYVGMWVDNFGTVMMDVSEGQASEDGKSIEFRRTFLDMVDGSDREMREVLTFLDDGTMTLDMYGPDNDGNEFHTMHIDYERR